MERNLDHRVETCFPLTNKKLVNRVKAELETYLNDNTHAWILQSDGTYQLTQPKQEPPVWAQGVMLENLALPLHYLKGYNLVYSV